MHLENRKLHMPLKHPKKPNYGLIPRLGFLAMQKTKSIIFTSLIPSPLERAGVRPSGSKIIMTPSPACPAFSAEERAGVRPNGIAKPLLFLYTLLLTTITSFAGQDYKISPADWHKLTSDKALNYKNDIEALQKPPVPQDPGAFQKFITNIIRFFSGPIGTIIVWTLVLGIIAYIVYRVFLSSDSFLFSKKAKKLKADEQAIVDAEDISTTNWDALLRSAIDKQDLRLAVRYSYMWTLQLLQKKELISYRIDKTNFEYYRELSTARQHAELSKVFRQLSRQYEYTWYGHYDLSGARYNEYIELFNHLKKQLGS